MAGQASGGLGQIVVGVDGSGPSKSALRWAARIAQATGATIQAITAWEYPTGLGWGMPPEGWQPEADMRAMLEDTLVEVFGSQRPPGLEAMVEYGPPRVVLLEAAKHAGMLVVGSRGHGGFAGLLLGSVSAACAEHAQRAVLVVHSDPP